MLIYLAEYVFGTSLHHHSISTTPPNSFWSFTDQLLQTLKIKIISKIIILQFYSNNFM